MQGFFGFNPSILGWVAFTAGCGYLCNPTTYSAVAGAVTGMAAVLVLSTVQIIRAAWKDSRKRW